jgi:hypothetical protein
MDSDDWALVRMVELRQAGEAARFRIEWVVRGGRRYYGVSIRRADGSIERMPEAPHPLETVALGLPSAVEESTEAEMAAALAQRLQDEQEQTRAHIQGQMLAEARVRELEQQLGAARDAKWAPATVEEIIERVEAEQRELEGHLDQLAPGSLRTFRDKIEWVANHAAEIGDPDVSELARRALEGDEVCEGEVLAFWRLWKGLDEPTDVP